MSYCRWSSMGYRCDLYIYDDVSGGVTIHVAKCRRVFPDDFPDYPSMMEHDPEEFMTLHRGYMHRLDALPIEDIGLPSDGASYRCVPYDEAVQIVRRLRAEGYTMPDGIEEELEEESEEEFGGTNE